MQTSSSEILERPQAEVADIVPPLDVLAEELRYHIAQVEANAAKTVDAMIMVGHDLIKARAMVPKGQLNLWAKQVAGMHPKTVTTYIRFANNAELLKKHQPSGMLQARKLLAAAGVERSNSAAAMRKEAMRLRDEGLTQREIGERLSISRARVSQLLNADQHKARERANKRERALAERALARERQAQQVLKSGNKHASTAYSHIRIALQELDRALATASSQQMATIRSAMQSLHEAEDLIAESTKTDWSDLLL